MENVFSTQKPVAIGADHAGFALKSIIVDLLKSKGLEVIDKGTYSEESVDYPDFAHPTAEAVEKGALRVFDRNIPEIVLQAEFGQLAHRMR